MSFVLPSANPCAQLALPTELLPQNVGSIALDPSKWSQLADPLHVYIVTRWIQDRYTHERASVYGDLLDILVHLVHVGAWSPELSQCDQWTRPLENLVFLLEWERLRLLGTSPAALAALRLSYDLTKQPEWVQRVHDRLIASFAVRSNAPRSHKRNRHHRSGRRKQRKTDNTQCDKTMPIVEEGETRDAGADAPSRDTVEGNGADTPPRTGHEPDDDIIDGERHVGQSLRDTEDKAMQHEEEVLVEEVEAGVIPVREAFRCLDCTLPNDTYNEPQRTHIQLDITGETPNGGADAPGISPPCGLENRRDMTSDMQQGNACDEMNGEPQLHNEAHKDAEQSPHNRYPEHSNAHDAPKLNDITLLPMFIRQDVPAPQFGFTEAELEILRTKENVTWTPVGDLYYGPSGGQVCVYDGCQVRKIRPSRQACTAPLAPITENRINLEALRQLPTPPSPDTIDAWEMLSGYKIRNCLLSAERDEGPPSRKVGHDDVDRLLEWDVMRPNRFVEWYHPVFKVPKGDNEARLIVDCRSLNRQLPKPGPMGLPALHEVLDGLLQQEWLAQLDGRSYFYQFPLDDDAQKLFGMKIGPQRGRFEFYAMTVLPMGYAFAPRIAQLTSNHILRNVDTIGGFARAWVDNFLFGAPTEKRLAEMVEEFRKVCRRVSLELKEEDVTIGTSMKALGVIVDAKEKTITPTGDMIEAVRQAREKWIKHPTPRTFFSWAGLALWITYAVTRTPLCFHEEVLKHMGHIGAGVELQKWDENYTPEEKMNGAVDRLTDQACLAVWNPRESQRVTSTVWTDASDTQGLGMIVDCPEEEERWWMAERISDCPIYVAELLMAAVGLIREEKLGRSATLMVDNKAAVATLRRGHSSSPAGNLIMRKLAMEGVSGTHRIAWVPSKAQRADALSRGKWSDETQLDLPSDTVYEEVRWCSEGEKGGY